MHTKQKEAETFFQRQSHYNERQLADLLIYRLVESGHVRTIQGARQGVLSTRAFIRQGEPWRLA